MDVAGVGKSTLAVYWAHQMRDRFPDGELYVNLRGFDPVASPMSARDALGCFLTALDVSAERIPDDVDARSALLRSLLHGRRMLLLLDNARDAEQIRPLLPGSQTCFVVVTSRNRLDSLVVGEGASRISLAVLEATEARDLLTRYLGSPRVNAEPEAVDELVEQCAGLPLALSIVAVRAAENPDFPLEHLVSELRDERDRLDALDFGGRTGIRAVFSLSYRALSDDAARLFRLLGLPTGPDISLAAAADLAWLPQRQARVLLAELARAHLVEQHQPGRYRFHDLLRAYAAECAAHDETESERSAAVRRLLDHYLRTSRGIRNRFLPHIQYSVPPPESEIVGVPFDELSSGMRWWMDERAAILAAIRQASGMALLQHAWQLSHSMMYPLRTRGHVEDLLNSHALALEAAASLGDRTAEAHLLQEIGLAYYDKENFAEAEQYWNTSYATFEELGDQTSQCKVLIGLGHIRIDTERFTEAEPAFQRTLAVAREAGDRYHEGQALLGLGCVRTGLGEYEGAIEHFQNTLDCYAEVGEHYGRASALRMLGDAYHALGRTDDCVDAYRQARGQFRDIGQRHGEATCLRKLGTALSDSGNAEAAMECWREALALLDELNHPDAEALRPHIV